MRKNTLKSIAISLAALVTAAPCFISPVMAASDTATDTQTNIESSDASSEIMNYFTKGDVKTINKGMTGTVTVSYSDDIDGTNPVAGAEFTVYKVADFVSEANDGADVSSRYRSVIPTLEVKDLIYEVESNYQDDTSSRTDVWSPVGGYTGGYKTETVTPSEEEKANSKGKKQPYSGERTTVTTDTDPLKYVRVVQDAYKGEIRGGYIEAGTTNSNGKVTFDNLPLGMYMIAETKAADYHVVSDPMVISVPHIDIDTSYGRYSCGQEWKYDITVSPKARTCGNLKFSKVLKGNDTEKDRDFHFEITLKEESAYLRGLGTSYTYTTSDGRAGSVSDGDTITLKGGESAIIDHIPAGTKYEIKEKEANTDGYSTDIDKERGTIIRRKDTEVVITNTRNWFPSMEHPQTGDMDCRPLIIIEIVAVVILAAVIAKSRINKKKVRSAESATVDVVSKTEKNRQYKK